MKSLAHVLALILISPLLLTHWLLSHLSTADNSLEPHSQALSLLPGKCGSYLRVAFYRIALEHCDPTATICFGVLFSKTGARVERHAYIGPRCMIGLVTIEEDVLLGPCVQIPSGKHVHGTDRLDVPIRVQPGTPQRITVGRDSWIGAGAIVLADVAEQNVIGAGSIVTKATRPQTINIGNPAREQRLRSETTSPEMR